MSINDNESVHYKSFLDIMYNDKYYAKTIGTVVVVASVVVIPLLIMKLNKKKKDIKNPINNESYCVISIHICNIAIVSLGFTFLNNMC